ncbi:MAG TPA: molybdopterin molybdenumtransferase MoeA, partial [Hyphomonadaceae bacterium]|nr:molybdopterin molybdenumtransferase MoeA [Hyphomonadaceae bacterium]
MLSVDQARAIMLGACGRLGSEVVALEEALGRTLAIPILAARDAPPFAVSAMDGYALAAAGTPG